MTNRSLRKLGLLKLTFSPLSNTVRHVSGKVDFTGFWYKSLWKMYTNCFLFSVAVIPMFTNHRDTFILSWKNTTTTNNNTNNHL